MSTSISLSPNSDAKTSIAREMLNAGDFMFSFALKSGYHHVEIFPGHRQYLSFSWTFSSGHTSALRIEMRLIRIYIIIIIFIFFISF